MPSLQPGTASEERVRRRQATRHQEKSQFLNVLRHADASKDAAPPATPQSRPGKAPSKRTGPVKDGQTHDKIPHRLSARPVDEHPEPDSLKSTVTPVFWDNPLKVQPHIYNPSPFGRSANHTPTKPSATPAPQKGGRAQDVTPRSSTESVRLRPRPGVETHEATHIGTKSSSKRPAVPVVASKSAFTGQSSRAPAAAAPPSSTVPPVVQALSSHLPTAAARTSTESLPTTGTSPLPPTPRTPSPEKGTRSKPVATAPATKTVWGCVERLEEWHEKRVNVQYPTQQGMYQKSLREGDVTRAIDRPPAVKPVEVRKGAKQDKSPASSVENLNSTAPNIKGSKTSLAQTGSTESLASKKSSKAPHPSASGVQRVEKKSSDRVDHRGATKPSVGTQQTGVKPSTKSARQGSPSTRSQASVKKARSSPDVGVSSTPVPVAAPEDSTRGEDSPKRTRKPWDGSTRAEERLEIASSRSESPESPVKSANPLGDLGTRAFPASQHVAVTKVSKSAVLGSSASSVKAVSPTKSTSQRSLGKPQPSIAESFRADGSTLKSKSSHKPSPRSGKTSQFEGVRKRTRTVSTTATVSDAPASVVFREDWPTPEELLSDMSSAPSASTSGLQGVSPMKSPASKATPVQSGSVASADDRSLAGCATLGVLIEEVEAASSIHQATPLPTPRVDGLVATTSDPSLQPVSQRSSGVSYATMPDEPARQDPANPPVTLRNPIARQVLPLSPLLHCRFESIMTDNNLCSVVTDNFDIESYPLACDRTPLPSIPVQVVSARPEVVSRALDLPTFTRGRVEPGLPALKSSAVDLKSTVRSVATVKEVRFTGNSSADSLLEDVAHTARRPARLSIFPNASTVTVATSYTLGLSTSAMPLPSSRQSPVPSNDIRQKGKAPAEDPPSYNDSVPIRKRTKSDATDKKDRFLLNATLPAPYIDSMFKRREAYEAFMASSSAQAQNRTEQNDSARKPSVFKRIIGQLGAPFGFNKKAEESDPLALTRSVSAQPRASPSTVHWIVSQTTRK
ncbi:hypothetical protein GSI_03864 [Ganoderma sinense ZZ0214-1]|uniref:Uncharacterized protein n=1 Tax=Ganoderma sinense ZZ0214-1 TaxID=1077348 RepID=A0A2G8SK79_9APHY|nr:hypothetical protein GSI_03864 [Ganoderma sinense ZZ0214-1]